MRRLNINRRVFVGGALGAAAAGLVGPAFASTSCGTKPLRIRVARDFVTFDPADAWGSDAIITRNILAPLMRYKPRAAGSTSWSVENHLISDHSISSNGLEHSFKLRDEVWAGGAGLTAYDVEYSFNRIGGRTSTKINANNAGLLDNVASLTAIDTRAFTLVLKQKDDKFAERVLADIASCVVPKDFVEQQQDKKLPLPPGEFSGRYAVERIQQGDLVELCMQDSWQGDKPTIKSARFMVILDENSAQAHFKSGDLDVYRPERDVLHRVAQDMAGAPGQLFRASTSRIAYAAITPFSDLFVSDQLRIALQQTIDPHAAAFSGYGTTDLPVPGGVIAPGWPGGGDDRSIPFDQANVDILRNGITRPLRILPSRDPVMKRVAAGIGDQLRELGVPIDVLDPMNEQPPVDALNEGSVDVVVQRSIPAIAPASSMNFEFSYAERANAELANLGQGDLTNEPELALAYQRLLLDLGYARPIVEDHNSYFVAPGIIPDFSPDGEVGDLGNWTMTDL